VGRPFDVAPAGILGANQFGLCIEHLGNFDKDQDQMTAEQSDTIVKLNAILCKKFSIPINTSGIVYHHWYDIITGVRTNGAGTVKTCPGTNFFGGNTPQNCESNFFPLVVNALQTL
jgi:N-acetylmuramoyl-L-alanine amidase